MKQILKYLGIGLFIAVKNHYNNSVGVNAFYSMLMRRLQYQTPENLAAFLKYELNVHFKECVQYQ